MVRFLLFSKLGKLETSKSVTRHRLQCESEAWLVGAERSRTVLQSFRLSRTNVRYTGNELRSWGTWNSEWHFSFLLFLEALYVVSLVLAQSIKL